jgi:single-stranded-DNA-specific exonuclease
MAKRWRFRAHDSELIARLQRMARLPPVVAQLLVSRGVAAAEDAERFMNVKLTGLRDPEELPGLSQAADRIHEAIQSGRRIVIYGDYDADGMTGTAVLLRCLQLLRANVGYHIPNRIEDGYGLNEDALRQIAQRGPCVVVTVDCGIASVALADFARESSLELIITDHHEFAERLPNAAAIVHPRLPGSNYPFGGLCGAGVAFKLAWALCQRACQAKRVSDAMREFLMSAVGIVAIGTVADVVPLVDENRILVRHGLESLRLRPTLGLKALMTLTGLSEKPRLSSEDIGFTIGPHLNAAGRLGQAQLGVELLTTESADRAQALAEYIHELNSSRESLERSIQLAATKQIKEDFDSDNDPAFVLAGRGWHPGVIGIVAGRLAEKHQRPVIVLALDQLGLKPATGSGRSGGLVDLHAALGACSEHLLSHGGHAAAAGLKIEESKLPAFRAAFCEQVTCMCSRASLAPELQIDAETALAQLSLRTVEQIEQLSPFGAGNPRPVLCATGLRLAEPPKRMGNGERHLTLRVVQQQTSLRAVGFGLADWVDELAQHHGPLDLAFRPVINTFRGQSRVELHLVDWRPSQVLAPS